MTFNNQWPEGRTDQERRFLARLSELQPPYCDVWDGHPDLMVTVDVVDEERKNVLRTLRVDFDGRRIIAGNDPTHQLAGPLDPEDPDWFSAEDSPAACAQTAIRWLRDQCARPIDRHEWDGPDHPWYSWMLADTGKAIVHQYLNRPRRQPDRIVRVMTPQQIPSES